ncbi:helix-turn-helix transcriptional regulator [Aestuariibius sp. 2305UL40-4]|uniref:helix-turn-helix transcriptional regulator n=1 Tax=Aestuariibius violaceus TaxID=3234132 RepID=UPI00345EF95B
MRRTDRLFDLVTILRDGRLHRARDLAERVEVSLRTIYRDMETLMASGIPVEGERGVGYRMTAAITLPPLNLTPTELEALHLGMAVVEEAADKDLQRAARTLAAKIDAVLPETRKAPATGWGFAIYPFADAAKGFTHMPQLRTGIRARQKLRLTYRTDSATTTRTIRPLQLEYWGRVWTVTCWCELRDDFRVFRPDRIQTLQPLSEHFAPEPGKTIEDYEARLAASDPG